MPCEACHLLPAFSGGPFPPRLQFLSEHGNVSHPQFWLPRQPGRRRRFEAAVASGRASGSREREESAVAILNTCTVTASADAEVRQFVRRIHRRNPQCRISGDRLLCPARAGRNRSVERRRLGGGKFPQTPGERHPESELG